MAGETVKHEHITPFFSRQPASVEGFHCYYARNGASIADSNDPLH